MRAQHIDHIGINVDDLPAAKAFFLELGFELTGEGTAEGEFVERVIGMQGVRSELAMLRAPNGGANIELVRFLSPADDKGAQRTLPNTHGIRHIAIVVNDLQALAARLREKGVEFIGEVQNYQDTYLDCYIRGPEGIILELAEELKRSSS